MCEIQDTCVLFLGPFVVVANTKIQKIFVNHIVIQKGSTGYQLSTKLQYMSTRRTFQFTVNRSQIDHNPESQYILHCNPENLNLPTSMQSRMSLNVNYNLIHRILARYERGIVPALIKREILIARTYRIKITLK